MGIFRNDPSPFIGGSQPLDGRRMNPALMGVTAAAPPLNRKALALVATVLAAWVPPDPPPFMGGRQPLQARTLPPQIIAVPVDNPPFVHRSRSAVIVQQTAAICQPDPWAYVFLAERGRLQPYGPGNLSPGIPGQSVDRPPSKSAQVISWPKTDPPVVQQRLLSPGIPGQSVDTVLRVPSVPPSVLASWQALDPLPTFTTKIVQPFIASASVPSVNAANLTVIVQSWQQPDPLQTLIRKLPPSVTAVSVNDPPFSTRKSIHWPLWQVVDPLPTLSVKFIQSSAIINNPSGATVPRIVVADPLPLPQAQKKLAAILAPAAQVDSPPFSSRRAIHWPNWASPDLLPTLSGKLNPSLTSSVQVDDPPFGRRQPYVWTWGDGYSFVTAAAAEVPQPVDNPPFGAFYSSINIIPIWWIPSAPQPTLGVKLVQPGAAVVVNDPPFSSRQVPHWPNWTPPDPLPTLAGKLNPSIAAVVVNSPSGPTVLRIVVVPQPPLPQQSMKIAAVLAVAPVNDPPFSSRKEINWAAYQPPVPQPTLSYKLSPSIIAVPVNNPPFTHPGRLQRDTILTAWQPPPPDYVTIKMVVKIVQEGPLPPPATQIEFFPFIANVGTMMRRG